MNTIVIGLVYLLHWTQLCASLSGDVFTKSSLVYDALPGTTLWNVTARSMVDCAKRCGQDPKCVSFFVQPPYRDAQCYGMARTMFGLDLPYFSVPGMRFYVTNGTSGNLAVGKPSTQSSIYNAETGTYDAYQANNGDHISNVWAPGDSCAHTDTDPSPWWKVDLGYTYNVARVSILTREDLHPSTEGQTANILVGVGASDTGGFHECGRSTTAWYAYFRDYTCTPSPIPGRFVKVSRWSDNGDTLVLCEVEVFAVSVV